MALKKPLFLFIAGCWLLMACNSETEQRKPPAGVERNYIFPLGIMYGSFSQVDETTNGDVDGPLLMHYEFAKDRKQLTRTLGGMIPYTYYYDERLRVDSVIVEMSNDQRVVSIQHKTNFHKNYPFYQTGNIANHDTMQIEIDTARRTVQLFRGSELISVDSFDASGLLVRHQKPLEHSSETYSYDEHGNCISLYAKLSDKPGDYREVTYKHKYDDKGNWIQKTENVYEASTRKKSTFNWKRVIKYD